jgi:hypothetical protein
MTDGLQGGLGSPRGPGEDGTSHPRFDREVAEEGEEVPRLQFAVDVQGDPGLFRHVPPGKIPRPDRDVGDDVRVQVGRPALHEPSAQ